MDPGQRAVEAQAAEGQAVISTIVAGVVLALLCDALLNDGSQLRRDLLELHRAYRSAVVLERHRVHLVSMAEWYLKIGRRDLAQSCMVSLAQIPPSSRLVLWLSRVL